MLACSPVFAQELSVDPLRAGEDSAEAAERPFLSAPSADANALTLQPFVMAAYSTSLEPDPAEASSSSAIPPAIEPGPQHKPRFHWRPALLQSLNFTLVMNAFRLGTEPSTRADLKGRFWSDYFDSVLGTGGWNDGDNFLTNYVGHGMEGAVAGYIYIQNDDRGRTLEIGRSPAYWKSRLRASAWATVVSLQFEFGPLSEASIGNVGMVPRPNGGSYMAMTDLVTTPAVGMAWMLAEDSMERWAVRPIERHTGNRVLRALARGCLEPSRSFANLMRGKAPWYRDGRPLRGSVLARQPLPVAPADAGAPAATLTGH